MVESLVPDFGVAGPVDQARPHPDRIARSLDASFEQVAHVQLLRELRRRDRFPLEREDRRTRGNADAGNPRHRAQDFLRDAVAEVLARRIPAQVDERQDGEGGEIPPGRGAVPGEREVEAAAERREQRRDHRHRRGLSLRVVGPERAGLAGAGREQLEAPQEFIRGLVAIAGILGQAAHDRVDQDGGRVGPQCRERLRWRRDVRGEELVRGVGQEREPAREHLVAHDAQGVDVGAMIDVRVGRDLLRRHVGRGADRHAERGLGAGGGGVAQRARDAEIGDERVSVGEQHVVRLDVAMHDPGAVRLGERIGDFAKQPDGLRNGYGALAVEPFAQGLALDERHHVVEERRCARGRGNLAGVDQP